MTSGLKTVVLKAGQQWRHADDLRRQGRLAVHGEPAAGGDRRASHGGRRRLLCALHDVRPERGRQGAGEERGGAGGLQRSAAARVRRRRRRGAEECDDGGTSERRRLLRRPASSRDASALCAGVPSVSGTALATVLVAGGLDAAALRDVAAARHQPPLHRRAGRRRPHLKNGVLLPTPFIDISAQVACCGEQGLLGMAFAPDYETNGVFYLSYTNGSRQARSCAATR